MSTKTKSDGAQTFEVIIGALLIIVLVVLATIAAVYERRRDRCYSNPSPWCYDDWECKDVPETDPRRFPAKLTQSIAENCTLTNNGTKGDCENAWKGIV